MATELRGAVRETWERALDEERQVDAGTVARRVIAEYPEIIAQEQEHLIWVAILKEIKQIARDEVENTSQLSLFGFPRVIAIPVPDDGYGYMRATKATWDDLVSGRTVRAENVRRAQEKLDQYDDSLERVRPVMEGTAIELAEALTRLEPE